MAIITDSSMYTNPTREQIADEAELTLEFSVLFREFLRALSANDPRGAVINASIAFKAARELIRNIEHAFSYIVIFEQAIAHFKDPPDLPDLEWSKMGLARAGMRFLATKTHRFARPGNYRSRLASDERHFDRKFLDLVEISPRLLNWTNTLTFPMP